MWPQRLEIVRKGTSFSLTKGWVGSLARPACKTVWLIFVLQVLTLSIGLISILVLPTLIQDIVCKADKWGSGGKTGKIDPFIDIYDVS